MLPVQTNSTVKTAVRAPGAVTGPVCTSASPTLRSTTPAGTAAGSVGAGAAEDRAHGLPENHQVEGERPVLDVADVDAHRVVPGEVRATADLPEPGKTRLDEEAAVHVVAVLLDLSLQRRAGADQRHVPAQHVDQLRQLVGRVPAQHAAYPRDARVVFALEQHAVAVGVVQLPHHRVGAGDHAAELEHGE